VIVTPTERKTPISAIPLHSAALCLEESCEVVFNLKETATCPACGGGEWKMFTSFLNRKRRPMELIGIKL
jgi:hypothetical protein